MMKYKKLRKYEQPEQCVTNGDESTNVNPRQVDYIRNSSREQQIIGENSLKNGGIYGTEK